MNTRHTVWLALLFGATALADPPQWRDIRDGSLYVRPAEPSQLDVSWTPAWQSEANAEQLYLLDPRGQLSTQLEIGADQPYGHASMAVPALGGDYRLQVPGYSFRGYQVRYAKGTAVQFEPTKVHFSMSVPSGTELYFRVAAGEQALLAGKHFGGVDGLRATRLSDDQVVTLELFEHREYERFEQVALPLAPRDEIWRLDLQGSGKAAFWLDGTANLFAQTPAQLHPLQWAAGTVQLTLDGKTLGPTPRLGLAMPYTLIPPTLYGLFDTLQAKAANHYSLVDLISQPPGRERQYRELYQKRFGIDNDITLLAGSGRRAVLEADSATLNALDTWLQDTISLRSKGLHYLAFADEPNLNYPDYDTFARYFRRMLQQALANPQARAAGVRIAVPASSQLLGGPLRPGALNYRGIDWTRKLLEEYGGQVDAVDWHQWMVRDLLATRRYRDDVRQAAALVGLDPQGRPRKALLLSQTNISSGADESPYQQDTHYAALWWASVVINASEDGLLEMLNWFQADDEPGHPKGMLRQTTDGDYALKPVGRAQQFIQQHWLPQVQALTNSAFEVDALAMNDQTRHSLLGVNKTPRVQSVTLSDLNAPCRRPPDLSLLGPDSQSRSAPVACEQGQVRFQLPGETLFALTWEAP